MSGLRWDCAFREPVVGSVGVNRNVSFDSLADHVLHFSDFLNVLAFEVLLHRLHEQPVLGLVGFAHVSDLDLDSHSCFGFIINIVLRL